MMTAEQLAEVRAWLRGELDPMLDSPPSIEGDWTEAVFAHIDALAEDLTDRVTEAEWSTKRAEAAEAKLAALVEAWDGLCMANAAWSPVGPQACRDAVPVARDKFHAAMGAARGEL